MQVIKRDGAVAEYDRAKIAIAIGKANAEVEAQERASGKEIEAILEHIEAKRKSACSSRTFRTSSKRS